MFYTSGDHVSVAHPCLLCQRVPGAATLHPQNTTSAPPGAPTGRHGLQGLSDGLTPTAGVLNKLGTPPLNHSHPSGPPRPALTHQLSPSRPPHTKQQVPWPHTQSTQERLHSRRRTNRVTLRHAKQRLRTVHLITHLSPLGPSSPVAAPSATSVILRNTIPGKQCPDLFW